VYRVDERSMWGRGEVDLGSMRGRCEVDSLGFCEGSACRLRFSVMSTITNITDKQIGLKKYIFENIEI
jgi:hypothetical protein